MVSAFPEGGGAEILNSNRVGGPTVMTDCSLSVPSLSLKAEGQSRNSVSSTA